MKKSQKRKRKTIYELFFKRFLDIILSLILLIVLSPVFLIVIILELCFHGWPPFFAHYRLCRNGKLFKMYKFRSMSNKRDANGELLPDSQRLTKFGKALRKTALDELPQLINILRGDMSFVGPRPRLVKDVIFYDEETLNQYTCRPGITCLAQVSGGRSVAPWEDIFEKDKEYMEKISFWGDVKIVFKTAFMLLKKQDQGGSAGDSKRDYYYPDYLLRTGQINKEQYDKGLSIAKDLVSKNEKVRFQHELQKQNKIDETSNS